MVEIEVRGIKFQMSAGSDEDGVSMERHWVNSPYHGQYHLVFELLRSEALQSIVARGAREMWVSLLCLLVITDTRVYGVPHVVSRVRIPDDRAQEVLQGLVKGDIAPVRDAYKALHDLSCELYRAQMEKLRTEAEQGVRHSSLSLQCGRTMFGHTKTFLMADGYSQGVRCVRWEWLAMTGEDFWEGGDADAEKWCEHSRRYG